MTKPFVDPIVEEKHRVQSELLREAGGDLHKYSSIVRREARRLRARSARLVRATPRKTSVAA
jgi:hypothetical protein